MAFHDVYDVSRRTDEIKFPGVLKVWTELARPRLTNIGMCATLAYGNKRSD